MNSEEIFSMIEEASDYLEPVIRKTPILMSDTVSGLSRAEVLLKMENFQRTGSFKVRGAYYKMSKMRGVNSVVAASSGNHAQGVAYSASLLNMKAKIVMPKYTPFLKVNAVKSYGAEVILHGETYDDAYLKAMEISKEEGIPFIHPFDDPEIIAGQGTIGLEISDIDFDAVLVPVGGGGLISGIAIAVKRLRPNAKVIGVQPAGAPSSYLQGGESCRV